VESESEIRDSAHLWYKVMMLPLLLPKTFVKQFNKLLFSFIWGSNWERIGRNILCGEIESGGIRMLYLESYLSAFNIKGNFFSQ